MMNRHTLRAKSLSSRAATAQNRALWLLLAAGLGLLAAAVASGEERGFSASRTDRFRGNLPPGTLVRVVNINGDVVAGSGREFSAVVTTTVMASSQARADEALEKARVTQSSEAEEYRLETRWPGHTQFRGHRKDFCRDCRVTVRYELVLPPGLSANLQTVNGDVRANGLDGDLEVHSVNGNLQVIGARRSLAAQTVNGRVDAVAAALPPAASWQLQAVNGSVIATLPTDAKFDWTASTMSGTIASTFALPPARDEATPAPPAAPVSPAPPRRPAHAAVVVSGDDTETLVDPEELSREIEESMREVEAQMRTTEKIVREVRVTLPERRYTASVGGGGAKIRANTLNGSITLLAAGTREADAKPLVVGRRTIVLTVPSVAIRVPGVRMRAPRVRVLAPSGMEPGDTSEDGPEIDADVVRGDISGDLISTSNGNYHVGHVSGKIKILTHSGEIHIASAGNGAEVKTYGGDIHVGSVQGDLRAQTMAGDIRALDVNGSAVVETSGGDIRINRIEGSASARTGGGDIVLPAVRGSVEAETGGGEVRVGILSRQVKNGISIHNAGGDVLLILPADFHGELDLEVEGPADPEEVLIRSEFPGVAITRSSDLHRASGLLNGGGPRVLVRTSSGSIRLRRGPAAGS